MAPFGQRVTLEPYKIREQLPTKYLTGIRLYANGNIYYGAAVGVEVGRPDNNPNAILVNPAVVGIGFDGLKANNTKVADLSIVDRDKFMAAKSAIVQLYGAERFKVECAQQQPTPMM